MSAMYLGVWTTLLLLWANMAPAAQWTVDAATSRLGFIATWEGTPVAGEFHRYDAELDFDPHGLGSSRFDVRVQVGSADTQSADRDAELVGPAWLAAQTYPEAHFVTTRFRADGAERYVAEGVLTLKGISRALTLPFTWRPHGVGAVLNAEVVLRRTDFEVGAGEWESGEVIGLDVRVQVHLSLRPQVGQTR